MPRHKGRPAPREVTIADCASVTFHENPTPRCPHGKFWRETDADKLLPELRERMCAEPGCESTEYHPHEGESITVRSERTFAGRKPLRDVFNMALALTEGGRQPETFAEELRTAVERAVLAWTWTGPDGALLPLPSEDYESVVSNLEYAELLWIVEAALGGRDPREVLYDRPLARTPGAS